MFEETQAELKYILALDLPGLGVQNHQISTSIALRNAAIYISVPALIYISAEVVRIYNDAVNAGICSSRKASPLIVLLFYLSKAVLLIKIVSFNFFYRKSVSNFKALIFLKNSSLDNIYIDPYNIT